MPRGVFDSPIGRLVAEVNAQGLVSLAFDSEESVPHETDPLLRLLEEELGAYFAGRLKTFSISLCPKGTAFQETVWQTLCKIPYGQTISYSEEACWLEHPKATRAVANANGKNEIAIIIPCHRVIAKDGSLGGYSSGIWRKEYLLALEAKYR